MSEKSILLLGPKYTHNASGAGGIVILFEELQRDMRSLNRNFSIIDTNTKNYSNRIVAYISILRQFFKKYRAYDHVSLHGTILDYLLLAPIVVFFSTGANKSVSLRKFAGNFADYYQKSSLVKRKLIDYILRTSDFNFFETKQLVSFFKSFNPHTYWFPNVRRQTVKPSSKIEFKKRFVFISHVKEDKGVDIILEASKKLSKEYTIDIYGPIIDSKYTSEYFANFPAKYKGAIEHSQVTSILMEYDVIMIPTFIPTEGYPGIITEGYSLGKPCIATRWNAIPEIVEDGKSGILIPPRDTQALVNAIRSFNADNYPRFALEAQKAFKPFDSMTQTKKFLRIIDEY